VPWAALLAVPLFVLAWAFRTSLVGQASAALLSALSCVTLGVLLSAVTPSAWLKVGIVAMAIADSWLVISDLLQTPNATLIAAHPGGGLPQLQSALFGSASMGYGDFFVAAVLGAVLAREGLRRQLTGALMTLVFAGLFALLFFVVNELPATVPVAATVIVLEAEPRVRAAARRRRARRAVVA
jgi:prepilin signal peptidase PulO-like enzyme (type II secretory pathway)